MNTFMSCFNNTVNLGRINKQMIYKSKVTKFKSNYLYHVVISGNIQIRNSPGIMFANILRKLRKTIKERSILDQYSIYLARIFVLSLVNPTMLTS